MFEVWYVMFDSGNMDDFDWLFVDEVVFCLFVVYMFYLGCMVIMLVLCIVNIVFEDFKYYCSFVIDDGVSVVLEFSVNVSGKVFKGIDMVCFNVEGKIVEFEVMVCLVIGLQVFGVVMGVKLGDKFVLFKVEV